MWYSVVNFVKTNFEILFQVRILHVCMTILSQSCLDLKRLVLFGVKYPGMIQLKLLNRGHYSGLHGGAV